MQKLLLLIAFGILLYSGIKYFSPVLHVLSQLIRILSPFLIGLGVAFILNVPMRFFERVLFSKKKRISKGISRVVSLAVTLIVVLGVVTVVLFLIIPGLADTMVSLANRIPDALSSSQKWANDLLEKYPQVSEWSQQIGIDWKTWGSDLISFFKTSAGDMINSAIFIVSGIVSGIVKFCLGFIFAIYLLLQKENLGRQIKRFMYAYMKKDRADKLLSIIELSNKTFSNFLSGQCLEALLFGSLFFIVMKIFNFPYALMISVFVGFTTLIPVFGAIIGCVVGAFIILIVSPIQAMWFLVMFIIMQQVEGNLLYPYVAGNSVGLPSIWILAAVVIGGGLMGFLGIVVSIPLCSVLYTLLRGNMSKQLEKKGLVL